MRFGPLAVQAATGSILAHSVQLPDGRLRKGHKLDPQDIARLAAAGLSEIVVATLDPGDIDEDAAALALATVLAEGSGLVLTPATAGRVNLKATQPGVLAIDAEAVRALNRIDPAITLATLPPFSRTWPGLLCGTVKIISYAVSGEVLGQTCKLAKGALKLHPVRRKTAGLILSLTPDTDAKLVRKAETAIKMRLAALGITLLATRKVAHDEEAIATALHDLPGELGLLLTGSATSDLHDTAPQALRRAGGQVVRFGMPVDPGNLLFHGKHSGRPVIGLPGCARSPALNGADWVLERFACGLDPNDDDMAAMGVGGLLKEISVRGRLRETPEDSPN